MLRERVAPGRLLTARERGDLIVDEAEREKLLKELEQEWATETHHKIRSGQMRSARDEESGIEVFRDGRAPYLVLNEPLPEENTRSLIERLAFLRTEKRGLGGLSLLIEGNNPMTEQARAILEKEKVRFYWIAFEEKPAPAQEGASV